MNDLSNRKCKPCEGGVDALKPTEIDNLLKALEGWTLANGSIVKTYSFKNYYQTMAFVNAVAYVAHREDHHPDLEVGYNKCVVRFSTHSVGGLSENDFIAAAKVDGIGDF